ncbi:MAG: peptidoglycan DD-metalloendopeptidase family protein [Propionibacteriaceae bacterium]|nr:peptidoglycan DD-metalloendopeptidase family protein [Propionibacteriaceae bacterium]
MKTLLICVLACVAACGLSMASTPVAQAQSVHAVAPVLGDVVRGFDPPDQQWSAGHRGVDIASVPGQVVVAAMDGVVSFAGMVVDRPVISVTHGDLTTTYEPVEPTVARGQAVKAGQPIGVLIAGHSCPAQACLHWGLKSGDSYLDPLSLLGGGKIRLITADQMAAVRADAARMAHMTRGGQVSAAGLITPVVGVVSDGYGMRLHPIEGVWKFHDGIDIAAACGSPILAAASGTVVESTFSGGYGYRLVIDHGILQGHALTTAYNHAQRYVVAVGDQVSQGQVVGTVGSTGESTGCHLHFQTWIDSASTDPQALLP